jgi:predicted heme/steroid binding protein
LLEWNGENGETYFYQSEYPYDVTQENYGDKGFAAYKVGDDVTSHKAYGAGVYSFFRDFSVDVEMGIKAPKKSGIEFTNSLSVFLNGMGSIDHVIDDEGDLVKAGSQLSW